MGLCSHPHDLEGLGYDAHPCHPRRSVRRPSQGGLSVFPDLGGHRVRVDVLHGDLLARFLVRRRCSRYLLRCARPRSLLRGGHGSDLGSLLVAIRSWGDAQPIKARPPTPLQDQGVFCEYVPILQRVLRSPIAASLFTVRLTLLVDPRPRTQGQGVTLPS